MTDPHPFQFSLRSIMVVTLVCCVLFSIFKAAGFGLLASSLTSGLITLSFIAGFALVLLMAKSIDQEP